MQRLYYMDFLRALAVTLGLMMHSLLAYVTPDFYPWYTWQPPGHVTANAIVLGIHIFYMPLFFLIAGFFSCQQYQKYGLNYLLSNRAKRIGIPFLILMLLLLPNHTDDMLRGFYSQILIQHHTITQQSETLILLKQKIVQSFFSKDFWQYYNNCTSYWFLYYLLAFYAVIAIVVSLWRLLSKVLSDITQKTIHTVYHKVITNPFIIAFILFYFMSFSFSWVLEVSYSFIPELFIICFYAIFYFIGWGMKQYACIEDCVKNCVFKFVIASVIFYPSYLLLWQHHNDFGNPHYAVLKFIALIFYVLMIVCWIYGSIGIAIRYLNWKNNVIRYVADASYWLYIAQIPLISLLQMYLLDKSWPDTSKAIMVFLSSFIILMILYRIMVRHTWIGQMLNGTRHEKAGNAKDIVI